MTVTVLFDADCGFCTRSIRFLVARGVTARCLPLHEVDLPGRGVDPKRAQREMPAVLADGRVVYGADAVRAALTTGPRWMRLLADLLSVRPLSAFAHAVYRWVAARRHRLPGGTSTCELPAPESNSH